LNRYFTIWVVMSNLMTEVLDIPAEVCRKTIWLWIFNGDVVVLWVKLSPLCNLAD